jgi:beta-lactam-binding protein with PASTA domain
MRALRLAVPFVLVLGLAACGSSQVKVMPDVKGKKLDVALSDIKRTGFEDKVDVVGGGIFGVVDESNWEVCDQSPAAGQALAAAPQLTVARSCGDETPAPTASPAETSSSWRRDSDCKKQ